MSSKENRLKQYSYQLDLGYLLKYKFPKLELGKSLVHGKGIIAKEDIKKGSAVCILYGVVYNMKKAKIKYPQFSYQISDTYAVETSNEPGFFNHSCEPNTYATKDWLFVAMRNIKKGAEILIDYGMFDYYNYSFKCECGTEKCRRVFQGMIAKDKQYQRKNKKYFSPYLLEKLKLS